MDERRRLLLVGDVEGGLAKLYSQVETQQKKVGAFNALFAVGAFLPALGDSESGAVLAEFVSGTRKVPIETFFIDSRSAAFLQAAPEGKQLCEKIHFLGGLGVRELHGLRVAYLSGCYDGATYAKPAREPQEVPRIEATRGRQKREVLASLAQRGTYNSKTTGGYEFCVATPDEAPVETLLGEEWRDVDVDWHLRERALRSGHGVL
ncbi:CWF19-like protein 1 [Durusdinium trenchii]|uniref:CWF19-like protein 1 n=1 Tax=Durusdinium trenchii TaxID=1381693 RepID=A0ABP0PNL4_9DINO